MKTNIFSSNNPANRLILLLIWIALLTILLLIGTKLTAQNVSITDDSTYTPSASAMLDVMSISKGLLVPRVSLTATSSESPISSPTTSLMVYNDATVNDVLPGYYYWSGTKWERLLNQQSLFNEVTKTASATLTKVETFVLASNDITITLPEITSADNGLQIIVKNIGTYADLITVQGFGDATICIHSSVTLTRWKSQSYIAVDGNWAAIHSTEVLENAFEVSEFSSWTTIAEMIAFLNDHMSAPALVRLGGMQYDIANTQVINLPYAVTFEGISFGHTTIAAATGLLGKPMFRCLTECYFKKLMFDATTLSTYGTHVNEDGIRLVGTGTYHEIKDCTFDGFYTTILDSTDAELWLFECDISNANKNGILMSSSIAGAKIRVSETDFMNCRIGVNFNKGTNIEVQLNLGSYDNTFSTDTSLRYNAAACTFAKMQINNNAWNNVGKFVKGFDFTRSDGRDANAYIENNAGYEAKRPHCKINVLNNNSTTTVTNSGTWVKANWTNTQVYNCKFAMSDNRITYLSPQSYDGVMILTGNAQCNNDSKILSIAIVKNGNPAVRYAETTVKLPSQSNPYQFATNVYLEDLTVGDYFEVWITSSSNNDIYKLIDVNWFTNTQ